MISVVAVEPTLDASLSLEMRAFFICEPAIVGCTHGGIGETTIRCLYVGEPRGQVARDIGMVQLQQPNVARADLRFGCRAHYA